MADFGPRPKLMAIGDSLAQGCRSLSVTSGYCSQSWPARMAQEMGWEFRSPDHPRPVLFDLEHEIRELDLGDLVRANFTVKQLLTRVRDNLGAWLAPGAASATAWFDNLAISGAEVHDLYSRSATSSDADIVRLAPNGRDSDLNAKNVPDLHVAINGRFVLNPMANDEFADFTPLEWVRRRRPEHLVVQIGHNHGLYDIGSNAVNGGIDGGHPVHGPYWDQWQRLVTELAALPAEIRVLLCLMPKIGAVGNLRPRGAERFAGYAETYEPVLSIEPGILSGDQLREIDAKIREANDRIRQMATDAMTATNTANRLAFFDLDRTFERFDFKNTLDASRRIEAQPRPRLMFMQSSGGLTAAELFQGKDSILSGPAGGVVAAVETARKAGFGKVIGFGESAKMTT